MADGEVRIDTRLDTSNVDKELKNLKSKIDTAGKSIDTGSKRNKNYATSLKGINTSSIATAAGVAGVALAIKKTVDALNECEKAYQTQRKAEETLQIAARNNPYLNAENVYNLKQFAGTLQGLSEIGDEVSIRVMGQLAATGRTEEQIMQIMSAAADLAATTGQDIASAAQQLNATLNGNAGMLGRQIGAISNLTKEELENGKAIELVAKQYKGAAAATADAGVQLSNVWGDFKEKIGENWSESTKPVKNFFIDVLSKINETIGKTRDLNKALKEISGYDENSVKTEEENSNIVAAFQREIDALNEKRIQAEKALEDANNRLNDAIKKATGNNTKALSEFDKKYIDEVYQGAITTAQNALDNINKKIEEATEKQANAQSNLKLQQKEKQAAKEAEEAKAKAAARDKEALEYIKANEKALMEQVQAMELRTALTGEEIDQQELYNAYLNSYIDLISKSSGSVSENNSAAKERLALLQQEAEKLKEVTDAEERKAKAEKLLNDTDALLKGLGGTDTSAYNTFIQNQQSLLDAKKALNEAEIEDEELKKQKIEEIDKAMAQNKKNLWANITADINGYTEQTVDIAKKFGDLMLKNVQTETDLELAKLDEKYEKGEMSEEEYYEKQKAIKRKAAKEEYKIQMFQWTASILAATANIAEGVSKAIAKNGAPAGLIMGALVGAAGAVQIASIIASKPVPPQFYAGGIIGGANGATYGSDNTYIHARTGEMVLNAHQQRSLWDMINGQDSRQQAGLNLTVNNTQANRVDADVREQNGDLYIDILDKHINKGFSDGTYDAGLAAMNTRQEGVRIL